VYGLKYPERGNYYTNPSLSGIPPWRDSDSDSIVAATEDEYTTSLMREPTQKLSYCWLAPMRWARAATGSASSDVTLTPPDYEMPPVPPGDFASSILRHANSAQNLGEFDSRSLLRSRSVRSQPASASPPPLKNAAADVAAAAATAAAAAATMPNSTLATFASPNAAPAQAAPARPAPPEKSAPPAKSVPPAKPALAPLATTAPRQLAVSPNFAAELSPELPPEVPRRNPHRGRAAQMLSKAAKRNADIARVAGGRQGIV
jgi:hypothetical protein